MTKRRNIHAFAAITLSQVTLVLGLYELPNVQWIYLPVWLFIGLPSALYDKTNPDWAPTKNMGHEKLLNVKIASDRHSRAKERGIKRKLAEEAKALEKPFDDQLHDEPELIEHEIIEPPIMPRGKQLNFRNK